MEAHGPWACDLHLQPPPGSSQPRTLASTAVGHPGLRLLRQRREGVGGVIRYTEWRLIGIHHQNVRNDTWGRDLRKSNLYIATYVALHLSRPM